MAILTKHSGNLTVHYIEDSVNPDILIEQFQRPGPTMKKGRSELKILSIDGHLFACRKYVHGGILRGLTKDIFLSENRAASELNLSVFLEEHGFPAVRPCGYIARNNPLTKSLYFTSFFEENAKDLIDYINTATPKQRLRVIRECARLFSEMISLGVYHPDLHLQNILVTAKGKVLFLDFDKARLREISTTQVKKMLWRLNRFAVKKEKTGELLLSLRERILFLKTIERLSRHRIMDDMREEYAGKHSMYRVGWFFESLIYRRNTSAKTGTGSFLDSGSSPK